jgi:hypothetical protein
MSLHPTATRVTITNNAAGERDTLGRAGPDTHRQPAEQLSGAPRTAATANAPITMRERLGTSADAYHARHRLQAQEQERMHVQIIFTPRLRSFALCNFHCNFQLTLSLPGRPLTLRSWHAYAAVGGAGTGDTAELAE